MKKKIDTLIEDIYDLLEQGTNLNLRIPAYDILKTHIFLAEVCCSCIRIDVHVHVQDRGLPVHLCMY